MIVMWAVLFQKQSSAFLLSVVSGAAIGVVYDLFRIFRVVWHGGRIKMFFEDVGFCITSAVLFCVFVFNANLGAVRLFMFFGVAIGFFSYRFSFGVLTIPIARFLKKLISKPIKRFFCGLLCLKKRISAIVLTRVNIAFVKHDAKRGFL